VQLGTRVLDGASRRTDQGAELAAAVDLLRSRLAEAQPVSVKPRAEAKPQVAFDGRADALSLVRLASPFQAQGGYQRLSFRLDQGQGNPSLIATAAPYRTTAEEAVGAPARSSLLLADLAAVEFAYFGRDAANQPPVWHAEWRDRPELPSLVRVRIAFRDGRRPPDLLVAPRLANGGK
jgi:general secretion pathway protein J